MKRLLDTLALWAIIIALNAGGAYFAYWGITQESLARSSPKWPSVKGTITLSYIQTRKSKGGYSYRPKVEYIYVIRNERFSGNRIYFGEISSRESDAAYTIAKYPVGKAVSVYYSPKSNEISCLEPGKYRNISSLSVVLGFTLLTIGIPMTVVNILIPDKQRPTKKP